MKPYILSTLCLFISTAVWAQEATTANVTKLERKADELELEKDVENMEQYGEAASAKEAELESRQLEKETKKLAKDIEHLRTQNLKAKEKSKRYVELFKQKDKLAAEFRVRAHKAEQEKIQSERAEQNLKAKVNSKQQQVIKLVEVRKATEKRLAELNREQRELRNRLARAETQIRRNQLRQKQLHERALRLAKSNGALKHKVLTAERQGARATVVR